MTLKPGNWATTSDIAAASEVVARLSTGLKEVGKDYESSCESFVRDQPNGKWWWHDSEIFQQRFLVTDIYEQLRIRHEFTAMAVPWKQAKQEGGSEFRTPPLIQVPNNSPARRDVLEHESIHVTQFLVEYELSSKPKVPFPGPFPSMSERILKEFEAYVVQSVYFVHGYEGRLILDFNCVEAAQLAALRAAFSHLFNTRLVVPRTPNRQQDFVKNFTQQAVGLAGQFIAFGETLTETFNGTILGSAGVVPTLDQLAFHLYAEIRNYCEKCPAGDPRSLIVLRTLMPVFYGWCDYESEDLFEILKRFRPPNPPPRLNQEVMD